MSELERLCGLSAYLTIAASTVASYLQRVYLKLGISGRTELRAFRHPTPTAA